MEWLEINVTWSDNQKTKMVKISQKLFDSLLTSCWILFMSNSLSTILWKDLEEWEVLRDSKNKNS